MFDLFLARLLVLLLICISCGRIFFTEHARIDSVVLLSPLALFFSLFILFIWGIDPISVVIAVFSFLVLFTNIRSLFRFASQLIVDHYGVVFILSSILELLAALFLMVVLIIFHPVKYSPKDFEARVEKQIITGNFSTGFEIRQSLFENKRNNGILWKIEPEEYLAVPGEPVVLFVGAPTTEISYYEPYLLFLADKGYRVLAADFYSSDYRLYGNACDSRYLRRFYSSYLSLKDKEGFKRIDDQADLIREKAYLALESLAKEIYGEDTYFFLVTEGLDMGSVNHIIDANEEKTLGVFYLNQILEFKTPAYGFVEQNNIELARYLGIERDSSFFIPRYVAGKTAADIDTVLKGLHASWVAEEERKREERLR